MLLMAAPTYVTSSKRNYRNLLTEIEFQAYSLLIDNYILKQTKDNDVYQWLRSELQIMFSPNNEPKKKKHNPNKF